MQPAILSFDQLFFDPIITCPEVVAAVKAAQAEGRSAAGKGQPIMLPAQVSASSLDLVARNFGADFARQIATLPLGKWSEPLISGFGVHLARFNAGIETRLPPLAEVRPAVAREWENNRREQARNASYAKLLAGYDVVVEARLSAGAKR